MSTTPTPRYVDPWPSSAGSIGPIALSREMRHVLELVERVAKTRATVLITGETGVGKEIVAKHLHRRSGRRDKPIVVFNCHATPETLLESELFGHERGAFSGAIQSRSGLFERANGSTLLLDEVGEIPLHVQPKLLRVLQERRFTRLGGAATHESDVRIIATSRHDLRALAAKGRFREDLFYRLNVFPIHVAPLRERREDIVPLATYFLEAIARQNRGRQGGISDQAMALLISYHWPGNVRELHSVIERALLLSEGKPISEAELPPEIASGWVKPDDGETALSLSYAQKLMVARALHENHWNFTHAATQLGVSPHVVRQLVAKYQLRRD